MQGRRTRIPASSNIAPPEGARILRAVTKGMLSQAAPAGQAQHLALVVPKSPGATKNVKDESTAIPKGIVIDVLVAHTKKAASHYSNIKRELLELSVEEANRSFRLSNVGHIKLRLVHDYQTDYVEEGAHFDHVWRFADKGDGYMDEVHHLRDQYRADVAILVVDDPKGCGLANSSARRR